MSENDASKLHQLREERKFFLQSGRTGLGASQEEDDMSAYERTVVESTEDDDNDFSTDRHRDPYSLPAVVGISAPAHVINDIPVYAEDGSSSRDQSKKVWSRKIADREDEYHARSRKRVLSPERKDAFSGADSTLGGRSYVEIMKERALDRERDTLLRDISTANQSKEVNRRDVDFKKTDSQIHDAMDAFDSKEDGTPKKGRWDKYNDTHDINTIDARATKTSEWDEPDRQSSWKYLHTPSSQSGGDNILISETPGRRRRWDATPVGMPLGSSSVPGTVTAWDATPQRPTGGNYDTLTTSTRAKSRWDETPVSLSGSTVGAGLVTPSRGAGGNATVYGSLAAGMKTPMLGPGSAAIVAAAAAAYTASSSTMTPEQMVAARIGMEMDHRNRPLSDFELDSLLPSEGYDVLNPPRGYVPLRTPSRKLMATPAIGSDVIAGFAVPGSEMSVQGQLGLSMAGVTEDDVTALLKPEDFQHFGKLITTAQSDDAALANLTIDEIKEMKVLRLLIRIKNGTPAMRRSALRQLTEKARDFGGKLLFDKLLPLLMSASLEDQERHLLVKVIDRILFKLDDQVRPFVHNILVVVEPLLIDEDYFTRVEGRELIANLSKAAGLASMIAAMRPDIDHTDEYVRNTTARAFAVVASALGIPALIPFLSAVCASKRSWEARHTGIKIVQQIALLVGCGVLPHLVELVQVVGSGLGDDHPKVRTMTALCLAALAEAAAPYGIEAFEPVLRPLWKGLAQQRSKALAALLKAIGAVLPLMDAEYAAMYAKEVLVVLKREFNTADDEMKKIVLKVVQQCVVTEGLSAQTLRSELLEDFFNSFWVRRMALDRRNAKQLIETTIALVKRVGVAEVFDRLVGGLKDESEAYRRMTMELIDQAISLHATYTDINESLTDRLIDGLLFAFQEQSNAAAVSTATSYYALLHEESVVLNGFGAVVKYLGVRTKPYLKQICSTILWRLNNKSARVRQQAAELLSRIASVIVLCEEEALLSQLSLILFEYLGEEFPDVLGSILGALKSIIEVIGLTRINPPVGELLPRLTPILKNRHEKVQENCIELVGRIADRVAEDVSPREWMRICFELLELLKAHKKVIRRAAVITFGYIAKAIGPSDVLSTLLSNLKVQERQNRVCTTIAIAIVADTCAPFTVLPALMNEYRVPELNVQNGVLKSLSYLFEHIGEMGKDYIYAVTPLIEDALMDRDLVHRQLACNAVKHMALGVSGYGCEDALLHLLNYVWPNMLEPSAHVIAAVFEALEGLRVAVGPGILFRYLLQGLFHPARRIRDIYWKVFNTLYVASEEALVPHYPNVHSLDNGKYARLHVNLHI